MYALSEKMDITEQDGEHYATAIRKYQPKRFKTFVDELERFAKTGNLPTDRAITFNVHMTVNNIHQGENGNITIGDIQNVKIEGSTQAIPEDLPEKLIRRKLKNID